MLLAGHEKVDAACKNTVAIISQNFLHWRTQDNLGKPLKCLLQYQQFPKTFLIGENGKTWENHENVCYKQLCICIVCSCAGMSQKYQL